MGYFGECKGTKINLPMESINKGFGTVPYCTLAVPGKAQLTKEVSYLIKWNPSQIFLVKANIKKWSYTIKCKMTRYHEKYDL